MEEKPSLKKSIKGHASAIAVGSAIVLIGGVLLALATGSIGGSSSDPLVVETAESELPPPENFRQAIAQRAIWESPPLLLETKDAEEPLAPLRVADIDIKVITIRELVENPERYVRNPVVFVGEIVEQQDVPGRFIEHEYRLIEDEPFHDVYVASSRFGYAQTGKPAWVIGQLIGVGSTRDASGRFHRSAYVDARDFDYEVSNISSYHEIGSRAVAEALSKLDSARQNVRP